MDISATVQEVLVRIVLLLTILFVGFTLGRAIGKAISRIFYEVEARNLLKMNLGLLLSRMAEYGVYLVTLILITDNLGITNIVILIIVGFVCVLFLINFVLQIVFAVPNILARFGLHKIKVGNKYDHKNLKGKIIGKHLFSLTIQTEKEEIFMIPYRWMKH